MRVVSYTAYVWVQTPDYAYWNPIKGTEAPNHAACGERLEQWIFERVSAPRARWSDVQTYRHCHKLRIDETPAHRVGQYL